MSYTALFFDKGGIRKMIPGFSEVFSMSELSFWGEYSFIDFAFYNLQSNNKYIICEKEIRKSINTLVQKWDEKNIDYILYNSDIETIIEIIEKIEEDTLIFYDINFAALLDQDFLNKKIDEYEKNDVKDIWKISINSVPVDIYIARKKYFMDTLKKNRNIFKDTARHFDIILDEIFTTNLSDIIDIEGKILFNRSVSQFFDNNLSLLFSENDCFMKSFLRFTPPPLEKESVIGKKGEVKNSIISSNTIIEGYVENSVIFSNVIVKSNTEIRNSVIMNGNQIGKNVLIENSLIFPNYRQTGNNSNIQDKCIIGGKSRKAKNIDFPEHIKDGLTMIGMNSSLPRNFIAEPGSLIGADIASVRLKNIEKIKRNGTIL